MYLSYYKLKKTPFQISTDPEFLWLGEKHREALAILKYGILDNKGFLLLTGDVGTGKTTLINCLVNSLGEDVLVARVPDPGMKSIDFMNFVAYAFSMGKRFTRKDIFLIHFERFLREAYAGGRKVLLLVDEAQRLGQGLLEEIRQFSNIERQDAKLLNIFLIGQNEFTRILNAPQNRALHQRIAVSYTLNALDLSETGELIRHRLRVAGGNTELFDNGAIAEIFALSQGIPRKINILCDHCLITGYTHDADHISAELVRQSAQNFNMPPSYAPIGEGTRTAALMEAAIAPPAEGCSDSEDPGDAGPALSGACDEAGHRYRTLSMAGIILLVALLLGYGLASWKNWRLAGSIAQSHWQSMWDSSIQPDSALHRPNKPPPAQTTTRISAEPPAARQVPKASEVIKVEKKNEAEEIRPYTEVEKANIPILRGTGILTEGRSIAVDIPVGPSHLPDPAPEQHSSGIVDEKTAVSVESNSADTDADQQRRDADIARLFSYLRQNSSEMAAPGAASVLSGTQDEQEPVDSGKVIDWLLSRQKK